MAALPNARHEAFAQAMAKGDSATAAYAKAGFKPNDGNCIRLKGNERVRSRIAELQHRAAERAVVTVEDIARQLDEDRAFAREQEAPAAMVAATLGKAKVLGLIIEKAENVNRNYDVTDEPPSEADWAREHAKPN